MEQGTLGFACADLHPSLILKISGVIAERQSVTCYDSYSTAHYFESNLTHNEVTQLYFLKYWAHVVNDRYFI